MRNCFISLFLPMFNKFKPLEEDENGYISKLDSNGNYVEKKWVTGLDAPKGLAIVKDHLFVADINKIWKISTDRISITNPDSIFNGNVIKNTFN